MFCDSQSIRTQEIYTNETGLIKSEQVANGKWYDMLRSERLRKSDYDLY